LTTGSAPPVISIYAPTTGRNFYSRFMDSMHRANYKMSLGYILHPFILHEKHTTTSLSAPGTTPTHNTHAITSHLPPSSTSPQNISGNRKTTTMLLNPRRKPKQWTAVEDLRLQDLYGEIGPGAWAAMARQLPGRTGKQVRERWLNHLCPGIRRAPWSTEEDRIIKSQRKKIGNRWALIAQLIKGRSDNAVKNRYYTTLKRREGEQDQGKLKREFIYKKQS